MNKNDKKLAIEHLLIMSVIGFGIGGGVSIIGDVPFLLTTLTFTTVCGTLSAAQTGLISEQIIKNKKDNIELNENIINHVKDVITENKKTLSQEKIDEIHARGKLTPNDIVKEWESLDLCAPGDAIGSAADRCRHFKNDCHECLIDYAYQQEEYEPINLEVTNSIYSCEAISQKEEQGPVLQKIKK